jgi:predicted transcriptional regulator
MVRLGRPKRDDNNLRDAIEMYMSKKKYTLDEIKEQTNISRATLYRHLDK